MKCLRLFSLTFSYDFHFLYIDIFHKISFFSWKHLNYYPHSAKCLLLRPNGMEWWSLQNKTGDASDGRQGAVTTVCGQSLSFQSCLSCGSLGAMWRQLSLCGASWAHRMTPGCHQISGISGPVGQYKSITAASWGQSRSPRYHCSWSLTRLPTASQVNPAACDAISRGAFAVACRANNVLRNAVRQSAFASLLVMAGSFCVV